MKPTVIIADDEEHVRDLLKMIADTIHFEVIGEGANGEDVITLFKKKRPNIMILDINMPIKTGDEVLEELKDELEDTCVLIMTAMIDKEEMENCFKFGANNFIRKDTPIYKMAKEINETWNKFEQARKNKDKFDLLQLLEEIKHEPKPTT